MGILRDSDLGDWVVPFSCILARRIGVVAFPASFKERRASTIFLEDTYLLVS
jgi:hypothetical protein